MLYAFEAVAAISLSFSTYTRENVNIRGVTIKNLNLRLIMSKRQSIFAFMKSLLASTVSDVKKNNKVNELTEQVKQLQPRDMTSHNTTLEKASS